MVIAVQAPKKLKTLDDVDQALHELSYLEHERQRSEIICQQELDAVKQRQADKFVLQIDSELLPISQRQETVSNLVTEWCDKQLQSHLPEGKKSIDLPHGTLGLRALPLKIECDEGVAPKNVLEKLDKKTNFWQCLTDLLSKMFSRHLLSDFITIEPKLSFTAILKSYKEHRVDAKALNQLGLVVREPVDQLYIKPGRYETDPNTPA